MLENKITEKDVKALQRIQKKLLGHELPKDISRDSLETTPLADLMNEYYQTYLISHDDIRRENQRDKVGVDFVRGAFIGLLVGIVLGLLDGDIFKISIVGGLVGGVAGALSPPLVDIINNYMDREI